MKNSSNLESTLLRRVRGKGRGSAFSAADFLDLGTRAAVDQVLSRLVKKGGLRRAARGLYVYPKMSPLLGELSPTPAVVAEAMASRGAERLLPTGANAAHQLGLTEQVPAKVEYLTDGRSRQVMIKKLPVILRQSTPRTLATAGRISGSVIQALRFLKRENVTEAVVEKLRERLTPEQKRQLLKDLPLAPAWMGKVFRQIAGEA